MQPQALFAGPEEIEPELAPGALAGGAVVVRRIALGSSGVVYEARDPQLERRVAVKVLRPAFAMVPGAVARFGAEARLLARLRHPHVVAVLGTGQIEDGRSYLLMEYVDGEPLEARLARGPPPLAFALGVLRQLASALDAVHEAGIAHRDVKPANIMLSGADEVRLVDFGLARVLDAAVSLRLTRTGALLGTPGYMAPEQSRGGAGDTRSDVYSFGVVAYELLAGEPPFHSRDALELLMQHRQGVPPPPSRTGRVPRAADRLVLQLLSKDPDERPARLGPVVDEIERALARARPARKATAVVAGTFVAAILVGLGLLGWNASLARSKPASALAAPAVSAPVPPIPQPIPQAVVASTPEADEPAPGRTVRPADPARIALHFVGAPPGTSILDVRGAELGRAPVLSLTRSSTPLWLGLRHKGFETAWVRVVPDGNRTVRIRLQPGAPPLPAAPAPNDVEDPFR